MFPWPLRLGCRNWRPSGDNPSGRSVSVGEALSSFSSRRASCCWKASSTEAAIPCDPSCRAGREAHSSIAGLATSKARPAATSRRFHFAPGAKSAFILLLLGRGVLRIFRLRIGDRSRTGSPGGRCAKYFRAGFWKGPCFDRADSPRRASFPSGKGQRLERSPLPTMAPTLTFLVQQSAISLRRFLVAKVSPRRPPYTVKAGWCQEKVADYDQRLPRGPGFVDSAHEAP